MADLIFCGNPGVGKSTLLTSVSNIQFESGFSWGEGLTSKLDFKESPDLPGVRFCDTPGLADIEMSKRAAEAITGALTYCANHKRRALIFFIVTVESGRVKPDDLFTIKQVMGSITFPNGEKPSKNDYGVIINKCTFLKRPDFQTSGRRKIESAFCIKSDTVPFTTSHIYFIPYAEDMVDQSNCKRSFDGLKEWIIEFPGIMIDSVTKIDVSSLEEKLKRAKELHNKEMQELEKRLLSQNKEVIDKLEKQMEETKRDMQKKIDEAQSRRGGGCCIL